MQLAVPDQIFLGAISSMAVFIMATCAERPRNQLLFQLVAGLLASALLIAGGCGLPAFAALAIIVSLADIGVWLSMRSWEKRRETEDAFWRAAGTLAGSIAAAKCHR